TLGTGRDRIVSPEAVRVREQRIKLGCSAVPEAQGERGCPAEDGCGSKEALVRDQGREKVATRISSSHATSAAALGYSPRMPRRRWFGSTFSDSPARDELLVNGQPHTPRPLGFGALHAADKRRCVLH